MHDLGLQGYLLRSSLDTNGQHGLLSDYRKIA